MNSEDFNRLEQLFFKFSSEIKDESQKFKGDIKQDFLTFKEEIKDDSLKFRDNIRQDIVLFKTEIKEEFQHQLTVQREDFQKQFTFIGEGFQMLSEKIDRVETRPDKRMDCLEHKIDSVAADLSAHRKDTEAHRPVYRVKE